MTIKLLLILLLTFALPVQAEIYKWTDADGKSHFSSSNPDHLTAIENRNELEAKSPQLAQPAAAPKVDLYVTSWCPYCKKAMAYLRKNNIAFTAYDIEKDSAAAVRKKSLDPGYSGIPLAVINGTLVRGFSEDHYQEVLAK